MLRAGHFSGWAGRGRAGADRAAGGRAHDREHDAAGPRQPARGRRRAGRAEVEDHRAGVVYRSALPGILTGVLLAMARISGETAPLLFTALNNQFWSTDMSGRFPTCRP